MLKKHSNLIIVFGGFFFFAVLTGLVFSGKTETLDFAIYKWVFSWYTPALTAVAKALSFWGSASVIIGGCVLLLCLPATRKKIGIPIASTAAVSASLNEIMKRIFQRARPEINPLVVEESFSFPSGHSMNNMAIYTMLVLILLSYYKDRSFRIPAAVGVYALVLGIGLSRIYLGVHYASDVGGGFLMGFVTAVTIFTVSIKESPL